MAAWHVPLADVSVSEEDIAVVADTYRSGWLSMGPRTEELEQDLSRYTGAKHAIAVTNGTAALHLICMAAGLGPGDEVVVPSMTFVATINAVAYTGAAPVFAEISSITEPWLSASAAADAITPATRAIMTVAYGGHPGETEALRELAAERGLILLEDAAHAIGSRTGGRQIGTIGAAGAYSFFSNKNLAVGEGGAVTTDDDDMAARMKLLRSHGMTTLSWDRHRGHATGYDVVARGFNYRIDEPRAALASRRLGRLDEENRRRHAIDLRYRECLADLRAIRPTQAPPQGDGDVAAHHLFTAVVDEGVDRDAIRASMATAGVQTSVHYPPSHRFSIYEQEATRLPLTDAYGERSITLPMFAAMSDEQQDLVIDALSSALSAGGSQAPRSLRSA